MPSRRPPCSAGIAVYGAGIMLIAQMYHMEGNPPDAVLLWALGALLAAVLLQSNPALAATFVLLVVWSVVGARAQPTPRTGASCRCGPPPSRPRPGCAGGRACISPRSASLIWLVPLGFFVLGRHAHWLVALIGAGMAVARRRWPRPPSTAVCRRAQPLFAYGVAIAFAALFIAQFIDDYSFFDSQRRAPSGASCCSPS